ncbi:MAG: hypothetical protein NXI18_20245 [Alphaproteobacteria bacterium]|nr:hypothetical protein [Alphaproteobacteria bacterium]
MTAVQDELLDRRKALIARKKELRAELKAVDGDLSAIDRVLRMLSPNALTLEPPRTACSPTVNSLRAP